MIKHLFCYAIWKFCKMYCFKEHIKNKLKVYPQSFVVYILFMRFHIWGHLPKVRLSYPIVPNLREIHNTGLGGHRDQKWSCSVKSSFKWLQKFQNGPFDIKHKISLARKFKLPQKLFDLDETVYIGVFWVL